MVQLPGATARLQAPSMADDRMTSAPLQQSRRRWQLKASAQVSEEVNLKVSLDDNNMLLWMCDLRALSSRCMSPQPFFFCDV